MQPKAKRSRRPFASFMLLFFYCFFSSCGQFDKNTTTLEGFLASVRAAHADKKIDSLLSLSSWDGVDPLVRTQAEKNFHELLANTIADIQVTPINSQDNFELTLNGKKYRPNLSPEARLQIFFKNKDGPLHLGSVSFLAAKKDGHFVFTFAAPISNMP